MLLMVVVDTCLRMGVVMENGWKAVRDTQQEGTLEGQQSSQGDIQVKTISL